MVHPIQSCHRWNKTLHVPIKPVLLKRLCKINTKPLSPYPKIPHHLHFLDLLKYLEAITNVLKYQLVYHHESKHLLQIGYFDPFLTFINIIIIISIIYFLFFYWWTVKITNDPKWSTNISFIIAFIRNETLV